MLAQNSRQFVKSIYIECNLLWFFLSSKLSSNLSVFLLFIFLFYFCYYSLRLTLGVCWKFLMKTESIEDKKLKKFLKSTERITKENECEDRAKANKWFSLQFCGCELLMNSKAKSSRMFTTTTDFVSVANLRGWRKIETNIYRPFMVRKSYCGLKINVLQNTVFFSFFVNFYDILLIESNQKVIPVIQQNW